MIIDRIKGKVMFCEYIIELLKGLNLMLIIEC